MNWNSPTSPFINVLDLGEIRGLRNVEEANKMNLTYKYRLYPNKEQVRKLQSILDTCRFLYNSALEERREAYRLQRVNLSYNHQQNELPDCKAEILELNNVHSQVLQDVLRRLDRAFANFFRRVKSGNGKAGFPRFKNRDRYDSFTYPQSGFGFTTTRLHLARVGDVKLKLHRTLNGNIKNLSIKREIDKWYACFSVELPTPILKPIKSTTGIDVGLNSFAVLSDGTQIDNPRWFREGEKSLVKKQRLLSRKVKGSHHRRKQRVLVAKAHNHIRNQRKDFQHKLSRGLVDKYNLIAYEDLNIKGMVRNKHLSKSISDAGWAQFIAFVSYKAEEAGGIAIAVNPSGTSINCSNCGFPVPKSLSQRVHKCPNCGLEIDRDWNAARNIERLGMSLCGEMGILVSMKQEALCVSEG